MKSIFLVVPLFTLVQFSTCIFADTTEVFGNFYLKNYPPYPIGKAPPVCKTEKLKLKKIKNGLVYRYFYEYKDNGRRKIIVLDHLPKNPGGYQKIKASLLDVKLKKAIISNVMVNVNNKVNVLIYSSYLNNDNIKDLILAFPVNNAEYSTYYITFLLSNKQSYSVSRVHSLGFSSSLFYDFNGDQKCEFLHLDLVDGLVATGQLGAPNYLTYNIMQFTPSSFRFNNWLNHDFAKWIEYKTIPVGQPLKYALDKYGHMPNSKASNLSESVKARFFVSYLAKTTDYNKRTDGFFGVILDQTPIKAKLRTFKMTK